MVSNSCLCSQGLHATVDSITRSLALEWIKCYDIHVNSIAPGPIRDTPKMDKLVPEEITDDAQLKQPLYRLGENWDIAMEAVYLESDAACVVDALIGIIHSPFGLAMAFSTCDVVNDWSGSGKKRNNFSFMAWREHCFKLLSPQQGQNREGISYQYLA